MIGTALHDRYDLARLAGTGAMDGGGRMIEAAQARLVRYRLERSLRRAALPFNLRR